MQKRKKKKLLAFSGTEAISPSLGGERAELGAIWLDRESVTDRRTDRARW